MVLWVFGYGSLVWNPGFKYDRKLIGFIRDHKRVFDLACIDHRGTPAKPARTCTLEASEGSICWGAAYCVSGGIEKEIAAMKYLEKRECEYDLKISVDFYGEQDCLNPAVTGVLVFTSSNKETNKYYLGPAPLEEKASQIATAFGPCGNNRDYLFSLEKAMFDIGHVDEMVVELANEVRKVLVNRVRPKKATVTGVPVTLLPGCPSQEAKTAIKGVHVPLMLDCSSPKEKKPINKVHVPLMLDCSSPKEKKPINKVHVPAECCSPKEKAAIAGVHVLLLPELSHMQIHPRAELIVTDSV